MATIQFYHLLSTPLEQALPKLMEKALSAGMKGVIIAESQAALTQLDDALWTADPTSFVPHALASAEEAARQPLCLSLEECAINAPNMLVITDGRQPAEPNTYERILDIFNGRDESAVAAARQRWKKYKDSGQMLQYIQQQPDGGWQRAT